MSSDGAGLRRELGLFSTTLLVVGGIIGSGIFFTPSQVARALPQGEWILAVWIAGGVVALAGALTYAELGAMMPDAGGGYVYIREAFGGLPAFLYGWMLLTVIATAAVAAVAMGFAGYFSELVDVRRLGSWLGPLGVREEQGGRLVVAAITILLVSATNYLGIKPSAFVQNSLTIAKIAALGGLIVLGVARWTATRTPDDAASTFDGSLLEGLATAFPAVLFTIGGWQQMNMVAGEIREPERTIPRALLLGIAIVIFVYLGANAVYLHVLGPAGLAASSAVAGDAATRLVGPVGGGMIRTAAMLSILGLINVVVLATPRIFFMMARDGVFPAAAARVHPRFGSPHTAIVVMAAWSLVLLLVTRGDIGHLISGVVFADWIFFALGGASVLALRRSRPGARRPYRVPGYPLVPLFFLLAACVGIVSSFVAAPALSLGGTALLALGVIIYFLMQRRAGTSSANHPRP